MDFYRDLYLEKTGMPDVIPELTPMLDMNKNILTLKEYMSEKKANFALVDDKTSLFPMGSKNDAVLSVNHICKKADTMTPGAVRFALGKIAERCVEENWQDLYSFVSPLIDYIDDAFSINSIYTEKTAMLCDNLRGMDDAMYKQAANNDVYAYTYDLNGYVIGKYSAVDPDSIIDSIYSFIDTYTLLPMEDASKVAKTLLKKASDFGILLENEKDTLKKIASSDGCVYYGNILQPLEMDSPYDLSSPNKIAVSLNNFEKGVFSFPGEGELTYHERRLLAKELKKAASFFNIPIGDRVRKYASDTLAPHAKHEVYKRLSYSRTKEAQHSIKELARRLGEGLLDADSAITMLENLDKIAGVDIYWGTQLEDPINSIVVLDDNTKSAEEAPVNQPKEPEYVGQAAPQPDGAGNPNTIRQSASGEDVYGEIPNDAVLSAGNDAISGKELKDAVLKDKQGIEEVTSPETVRNIIGKDGEVVFNALPDPYKEALVSKVKEIIG